MCTSDQSCPEGATNPVLRCTLGEFPSPLFEMSLTPSIILSCYSRLKTWGGRWDSNPRLLAPQASVLPLN